MIPFDEACAVLRETFDVPPEALERAETILELQHASLAMEPPAGSLPAAAAVATIARLRSGEPIIPRERWPIEPPRVARLLRVLGGSILAGTAIEEVALPFAEAALVPAQNDDAAGVLRVAEQFGLPPDAAAALLRESLKPEMLRLSLPFASMLASIDAPHGARCPACGDAPCAGTQSRRLCCRWCGSLWAWDARACPSCGKAELKGRAVERLLRDATILQCAACGDAIPLFAAPADALLLSLLAVLASPLDLAVRIAAEAKPGSGFSVF